MWGLLRELGRLTVCGTKIAINSVRKSVCEEIELSNQLARIRRAERERDELNRSLMSLQEAMRILNVDRLDKERVDSQFRKLFEMNERPQGGSFYLQSKVVRAKQRIYVEFEKVRDDDKADSGAT